MGKFLKAIREALARVIPSKQPVRMKDLSVLKKWEGCRLEAYQDGGGVWTIGWGHTKTAHPGMKITQERADILLKSDLTWVHLVLNSTITVPVTQNQYDALGTFVYNIGGTQWANSTLLRKLNEGKYHEVPKELMRWVYDNGEFVQGLKNRRKDTARLFLS